MVRPTAGATVNEQFPVPHGVLITVKFSKNTALSSIKNKLLTLGGLAPSLRKDVISKGLKRPVFWLRLPVLYLVDGCTPQAHGFWR